MTSYRPARTSSSRSTNPNSSDDRPRHDGRGRSRRPSRPARHDHPKAARPRHEQPARSGATEELDALLAAAERRPAPEARSFAELGLPAAVVETLAARDIVAPTPIQALTLTDALAGRDVLGRAQTGSGKTLGFGLPMLARLADGSRPESGAPRGLVLVPTRELAQQVADALAPVAATLHRRLGVVVGGTSINRQVEQLRRGVDVLVATPGRLIDLMDRQAVRLDAVEIAVLDEADHMADLGFLPAVTRILDATPADRQCLLFSATLDRAVARLVTRYLHEPAVHAVAGGAAPAAAMDHQVLVVDREDKVAVAAEIGARPGRTLFFVRTKHGADRLARQLSRLGVDSVAIHGNLNQNQRTRALDAFSSGRSRVLTATDVAARGIHVDDLDLVVHFDPPEDHKAYLHRSGRTARAGASGTVVSFVQPDQRRAVAAIHRAASVTPAEAQVAPGHPAVRALAESGEVIEVVASPPAGPERSRAPRSGGGPRQRRPRPRQASGGGSANGHPRRGGRPARSGGRPRTP